MPMVGRLGACQQAYPPPNPRSLRQLVERKPPLRMSATQLTWQTAICAIAWARQEKVPTRLRPRIEPLLAATGYDSIEAPSINLRLLGCRRSCSPGRPLPHWQKCAQHRPAHSSESFTTSGEGAWLTKASQTRQEFQGHATTPRASADTARKGARRSAPRVRQGGIR